MSGWKAARIVPATERARHEQALEYLAERGFVVTSREISRDGPWRIEIYGEGDRPNIPSDWEWEVLPEKDWVAENQRSFQPFIVGPFWVHPSHVTEGQLAGTIALRIDAGLAFGTGTHATTRGCLELLATLDPANAVDVGCGSGILAIAMAKLWRRPVIGGDNDGEAVGVAIENARLNGVDGLCRFVEAVGLDHPEIAARRPFDLVVANILASPLLGLVDSFAEAVTPGGRALLSGLLLEQADEVVGAYRRKGFAVESYADLETGGAMWRSLLMRKEKGAG
jgi:ribosomal protein L11 methyltransferase